MLLHGCSLFYRSYSSQVYSAGLMVVSHAGQESLYTWNEGVRLPSGTMVDIEILTGDFQALLVNQT